MARFTIADRASSGHVVLTGPLITIPAVLGIALVVLLSGILYPLRFLPAPVDDAKP